MRKIYERSLAGLNCGNVGAIEAIPIEIGISTRLVIQRSFKATEKFLVHPLSFSRHKLQKKRVF